MPQRRPRVLVVGPVHGATGGVAMFTETLLASRLGDAFEFLHLDTTRTAAGAGRAATLAPVNLLYFVRQLARLAWLIATRRPRIVHQPVTSGISFWKEAAFMGLARLGGARVVGHLHGARFREFHDGGGAGRRRAIRWALRRTHVLIVLSEGWQGYLRDRVDASLVTAVVANPIDRAFADAAGSWPRDGSRSPCTVLFAGRLALIKGILSAFAAIPRVQAACPGTRFVFAGAIASGGERDRIEQARAGLPTDGTILFPGMVSGNRKLELFAGADILILPSSHENLPIVILEALAAGLPLVVTPVGALPEFLAEGVNALFVPAGDAAALADRLISLVRDGALRSRMGAANRALYCARFEPERILDRIAEVYHGLLDRP